MVSLLTSLEVTTVAGTGTRGLRLTRAEPALETALNVLWDLALSGEGLLISLAGASQLAILDIDAGLVRPFADTGEVTFAAPAGLDVDATGVGYVADAESSSSKRVAAGGSVEHLAGGTESLFEFGDRDSIGAEARLQWPLGIAVGDEAVWVADTYTSEIKRADPATGEVETLVGGDGWRDGGTPSFQFLDNASGDVYELVGGFPVGDVPGLSGRNGGR